MAEGVPAGVMEGKEAICQEVRMNLVQPDLVSSLDQTSREPDARQFIATDYMVHIQIGILFSPLLSEVRRWVLLPS